MLQNSFEVPSFITDEEIKTLLKFYSVLPKKLNSGNSKQAYTTGFPIENIPIKDFQTRIKNIFGECKIQVSMFLEEFDPWTVHSDYDKGDASPYYAFLVPLDYDDKHTHTIIFNELCDQLDWKEKLIEEKGYNYSGKELKLLSHIDVDVLKKLTIDKVCKWQTGDMIAWHRKLLHCSDNFPLYGPKRKTALVLFLNRDD